MKRFAVFVSRKSERLKKFKTILGYTKDQDTDEYWDEFFQEINQEFTSENTSINGKMLPEVFNKVSFKPGTINVDYGGGKFDNVAEYLTQYDVINLVYDPYNRTSEHNKEVIDTIRKAGGADSATLANVLNVIKEPEVRSDVLRKMKKMLKPGADVYIQIYEGNKSGEGAPTSKGYQTNKKAADFEDEIMQYFPNAKRRGNLFVATNTEGVAASSKITASASPEKLAYKIDKQIEDAVRRVFTSDDFGFEDSDVEEYSSVETSVNTDGSIKIEVRAEVSYDGLITLADKLDSIVQRYDKNAYFDAVEPGIIAATIEATVNSSIMTSSNEDTMPNGIESMVGTDFEIINKELSKQGFKQTEYGDTSNGSGYAIYEKGNQRYDVEYEWIPDGRRNGYTAGKVISIFDDSYDPDGVLSSKKIVEAGTDKSNWYHSSAPHMFEVRLDQGKNKPIGVKFFDDEDAAMKWAKRLSNRGGVVEVENHKTGDLIEMDPYKFYEDVESSTAITCWDSGNDAWEYQESYESNYDDETPDATKEELMKLSDLTEKYQLMWFKKFDELHPGERYLSIEDYPDVDEAVGFTRDDALYCPDRITASDSLNMRAGLDHSSDWILRGYKFDGTDVTTERIDFQEDVRKAVSDMFTDPDIETVDLYRIDTEHDTTGVFEDEEFFATFTRDDLLK